MFRKPPFPKCCLKQIVGNPTVLELVENSSENSWRPAELAQRLWNFAVLAHLVGKVSPALSGMSQNSLKETRPPPDNAAPNTDDGQRGTQY